MRNIKYNNLLVFGLVEQQVRYLGRKSLFNYASGLKYGAS